MNARALEETPDGREDLVTDVGWKRSADDEATVAAEGGVGFTVGN